MISYLVPVREKVSVTVAANELAKLSLRVDGGHSPIGNPIVMPGTHEVLVGVCDSIRVVVHGFVVAKAGDRGFLNGASLLSDILEVLLVRSLCFLAPGALASVACSNYASVVPAERSSA